MKKESTAARQWGALCIYPTAKLVKVVIFFNLNIWNGPRGTQQIDIYSRKFTKIQKKSESLWYLNQDPLPPSLLPSSSGREKLHSTLVQPGTQHFLSHQLQWEGSLPWRDRTSAFIILPYIFVAEVKFSSNTAERSGFPAFAQPPLVGWMLYLWHSATENTGALTAHAKASLEIWHATPPYQMLNS